MANKLYRGAQMHQGWKRSLTVNNVSAIKGVATQLPVILSDKPHTKQAVRLFFGPTGGPHRLACLGVDFDVDLENRLVTWLQTARWPILGEVIIDYYTQGWYA